MKDVNQPFKELVDSEGKLYVAQLLDHKTTDTVSKWYRDIKAGKQGIPDSRYKVVYEMLVKAEVIS